MLPRVERERTWLYNGDGWRLDIKRYWDRARRDPAKRPILIIPGYCMNTFILAHHPRGTSLVQYLAEAGYEVFTANLRGQGDSQRTGVESRVGFREICLVDLPKVVAHVHGVAQASDPTPTAVGCSLGGTYLFGYLAHHPTTHGLGGLIGMGAPLRWTRLHPLLRVAFRSPRLASVVRVSGTRGLAKAALPLARRVPGLLSLYMNTAHIDLSDAATLTQTVDDPHPYLNVQIAHWARGGDLKVAGLDVTRALAQVRLPYLGVYANGDGIVPPEVARSPQGILGSADLTLLEAGDDAVWFAHADMFINDHAEARVFAPMVRWLDARGGPLKG